MKKSKIVVTAASSTTAQPRLYTYDELEKLCSTRTFKSFCKKRCAVCNCPAMKRFASSSPLVVKHMIKTAWCKDCGRILCDLHRIDHPCERVDAEQQKRLSMRPEDLLEQVRRAEEASRQAEAEALRIKKALADEEARLYRIRDNRRKDMAGKASRVATYLQNLSLSQPGTRQPELLSLYTKANRISIFLWNEVEMPTTALDTILAEEWRQLVSCYERAYEITGIEIIIDGRPIELEQSEDPSISLTS